MSTPLSSKGQWQSRQLANYLGACKKSHPTRFGPTYLYSSPLQRAVETAKHLEPVTDFPLQMDVTLQELHQGIFQGLTWAEASHRYPDVCAAQLETLEYQPVPEAETMAMAHQRARNWYQTLWQRHSPGDSVWIVTHGGFMQHLLRVILGCDRIWQLAIHHTALFEFWLLKSNLNNGNQDNPEYRKILKFNEIPHLGHHNNTV